MKRFSLALVLALVAAPLFAATVTINPATVVPAHRVLTADDSDVAILIGYPTTATGVTAATTTVEVDADSINLLVSGVAASGILCPAGGTAGEIDLTDASCDTLGEIVNHINASASGIKAVILDGLASDYAYNSDKKLLTTSATTLVLSGNTGVSLKWDTSTLLGATQALVPPEGRKLSYYLQGSELKGVSPFYGKRGFVDYVTSTASTCTAAGIQAVYGVVPVYGDTSSETVSTPYSAAASGTSAVNSDFLYSPLVMGLHEKIVIRRTCGTGFVVTNLRGQAIYVPAQ